MKILVLGLGVIGSTYGYIFKQAGNTVHHLLRKSNYPTQLKIKMLDGRTTKKGKFFEDNYQIQNYQEDQRYDLIILSVSSGHLREAVNTLRKKHVRGTILLFCNFWHTHAEIESIMNGYKYIIGFPVAGGQIIDGTLNCVVFDHILLQNKSNVNNADYTKISSLCESTQLGIENQRDMIEWIWLHMAINAGVVLGATNQDVITSPSQMAIELMNNQKSLEIAIRLIRNSIKITKSRGVKLRYYLNELWIYYLPANISSYFMKKIFKKDELARKIMTLHNDLNDMLFGCRAVYETGKKNRIQAQCFYDSYNRLVDSKLINDRIR
ncbi:ketopantoate reductase family protein [Convivina intestini]|uniref:ketopantoate reductase family protein n=1 Tax=Convivina intestini TaxID=1505726 RepID=UPI00200F6ED0|nr:2-dehydropantoate 2-reductase N-terminal domain-containing protein [Convivina intestini]CAH1851773.1 hypothetical protein R078131_00338 [Convivina intestini]